MDDGAFYRLMSWLSPSYPVGAFSYSHGIEWAVEAGDIADAETLQAWLADLLTRGSGRNDAVLFAVAWRAVTGGDAAALAEAAEWATALAGSKERRLETLAQGTAFLRATADVWPDDMIFPGGDELDSSQSGRRANNHSGAAPLMRREPSGPEGRARRLRCDDDRSRSSSPGLESAEVPYPVAVATAAAAAAIPLRPAMHAYLHAYAGNLISAGVRLIPLGQTDGLRVLAALEPVIAAVLDDTRDASLADLGGATLRADIASMRHETQYTRLFRS